MGVSEPSGREHLRDLADRPDQLRSRPPRVRRRDARGAVRALRRARALARRRRAASCGRTDDDRALVQRRDHVRPRGAVHGRPRGRRRALRLRAARRRGPADVPLHRAHPVPGPQPAGAGRAHPVEHLGAVPHAGRGLAGDDQAPPRRVGLRAAAQRHDRRPKRYKRDRGLHSFDACVAGPARARAGRRRGDRSDEHGIDPITPESPSDVGITSPKSHLERLVDSLLFEGYALYPYTPGATKNATPTPFGIVYPRDYAQQQDARLRPHADAGHRRPIDARRHRRGALPAGLRRQAQGRRAARAARRRAVEGVVRLRRPRGHRRARHRAAARRSRPRDAAGRERHAAHRGGGDAQTARTRC